MPCPRSRRRGSARAIPPSARADRHATIRRHGQLAEPTAELVEGDGDMDVLVRVDADGDLSDDDVLRDAAHGCRSSAWFDSTRTGRADRTVMGPGVSGSYAVTARSAAHRWSTSPGQPTDQQPGHQGSVVASGQAAREAPRVSQSYESPRLPTELTASASASRSV